MTLPTDEVVVRQAGGERGTDVSATLDDAPVPVAHVGSTGIAELEPLLLVTNGGQTGVYPACKPDQITDIATACLDGDVSGADPAAVISHDPAVRSLPVGALGDRGTGTRAILAGCGWRRPTAPDDYAVAGGFTDPSADAVFDAGMTLQGRGWGDWCQDEFLDQTWRTARDAGGETTVVVNAHGSATDSLLARSAPLELLDGATSLARALDAASVRLYLSVDDSLARDRLQNAVDRYPQPSVEMSVDTGPAVYRAAEPTMALEAIEGNHRLEARLRPPGPERAGLDGGPTVVHTARTMARLAYTLRTDTVPESRLVTVKGDVATPATTEILDTEPLSAALDSVSPEGEIKAACVGGRFGGLTDSLDVTATPAALTAAGLGTDATVTVLSADRCLVEFVGKRASFAADTNCGRCVPCREGTTQLAESLRAIYDGSYDRQQIDELADVMETTSICAFGQRAGRPARTAMETFATEFLAHADGRCPAGQCFTSTEVPAR